ncbi:MAG: hypothetical protein EHM23_29855 [Acidobacteria bacterium]|nr:MAG: hypothetical protein EHM23_29855 [Acidobacteriota bacterium]
MLHGHETGIRNGHYRLTLGIVLAGCAVSILAAGQESPGGPGEPVRYVGRDQTDGTHEGGLRLAVGVKSYQVFRANKAHPEQADGYGWLYNHAPMLAYWQGRFYLEYLSGPVHENKDRIHTLLTWSSDGRNWEKPTVIFPVQKLPDGTPLLMHQRMGFHVAPNGRLLVLGFYGKAPHPNDGTGIGRVVREVLPGNTFGPIYFIRYNAHNGWSEANTPYPLYTRSSDKGFKDACEALLANKLMTMQWWEEDRSTDGFYYPMGQALKALSFFHRKDGKVVGLWKSRWASITSDEGKTWSKPVEVPTLVMAQAKVWGQRTDDGRYALLYNPRNDNRHRYPLAIVTGEDGITFDNLLTVQGEVPPRRYNGTDKAFGMQYVRGIAEGDGNPPGNDLWVAYSSNKEDVWVSRIPVPVRGTVKKPVRDDFNGGTTDDLEWNLHTPLWAQVGIAPVPSAGNRSLELRDSEPADYAKAVRVFPESFELSARFKVQAKQANHGRLEIELADRHGYRPPIRLFFTEKGQIVAWDGNRAEEVILASYRPGQWYEFEVRANVEAADFTILLNGKPVLEGAEFLDPVDSLERLILRTGPFREAPTLRDPKSPGADLPNADERVPEAIFYIDDVVIEAKKPASVS